MDNFIDSFIEAARKTYKFDSIIKMVLFNSNKIKLQKRKYSIQRGCYRSCIMFPFFVIKYSLPQYEYMNKIELAIYDKAVEAGLGSFFPKFYNHFRAFGIDFYVYERIYGKHNPAFFPRILENFIKENNLEDIDCNYMIEKSGQIKIFDWAGMGASHNG